MRGPVQARGGHTALPNELLALALADLTADQFRLLVGIFFEAEFKREGATAGHWRVPFGHALVSYEGLSARYGLSVDAVRRALRRFERLGIATRRAEAATQTATQTATSPAAAAATPPTLVDLGKWGAFLGSEREAATPSATPAATPPATQAAPIQHENTRTPNTEKRAPPAASPPEAPREPVLELISEAPAAPQRSPHQIIARAWFERWERAGRGKHPPLNGAEGATIKRLAEDLGVEDTIGAMDRAFLDSWFLKHGDLLTFGKQRAKFAPPGRPAARDGAAAGQAPATSRNPAWIERQPEPGRSVARATWAEKRAEVERMMEGMRPEAIDRTLFEWSERMREDFERPLAAAGGAR